MFKTIVKVFLIFILVIALLVISVSVYVLFNGRKIFLSEIEKNLGVKAEMSALRLVFPSTLVIDNFKIDDYLKIARISVTPSVLGFLKGDIVFNSVIVEKPYAKVTRKKDGSFDFGVAIYKKGKIILPHKKALPKTAEPQGGEKPSSGAPRTQAKLFYFDKLKVSDGNVEYIDQAVLSENAFIVRISDIGLDAFRPSLLEPFHMQFKGQANLLTEQGQRSGDVNASGWVDIASKAMDVKSQVNNLQLVNFQPYYKKFLKRDLTSGDMLLGVLATSRNNDLNADCHVEMSHVAFANPEASLDVTDSKDFALLAIDSMLMSQGKAVFDFSIRTKLDNPKFEHIKFKGSFFQTKIQDVLSNPDQVQDIGKQFKAIGKQFKGMFKTKE